MQRRYEHEDFIQENCQPQRAYYIPYDSLEKALKGDRHQSKYYKLLNGEWSFAYYDRDIDVPTQSRDIPILTTRILLTRHMYRMTMPAVCICARWNWRKKN